MSQFEQFSQGLRDQMDNFTEGWQHMWRKARHAMTRFTPASPGSTEEQTNQREKRWNRDMPAYKRLRKNGLQPKSVDGAAKLESQATTKQQIETGRL